MRASPLTLMGATAVSILVGVLGWITIGVQDVAFPAERADSTADWLAASAFASGVDPHSDLRELAEIFRTPYWSDEPATSDRVERHPRTPGALLMLYPLSWATPEQTRSLMLIAGLVATAATLILLWKAEPMPPLVVLVAAALATVSGPALWSQRFVTQGALVMLGVAIVVVTARTGDFAITGVALAIAASLKVFPLVLLAVLVARRRYKALAFASAALALLNLAPLLLSHVSMTAMVDAFALTSRSWTDITPGLPGLLAPWLTLSMPTLLSFALILLLPPVALVLGHRVTYGVGVMILLAAALLALPLSWPHYLLALVPAFLIATRESSMGGIGGFAMVSGALLLMPMTPMWAHSLGLSVILVGVTVTVLVSGRSGSGPLAALGNARVVVR